jgi:hydroxyethylthiazole kinase-like uncharacterized protein yjeF
MFELLTNAQMRVADQLAVRTGLESFDLVRRAGQAVAQEVRAYFPSSGESHPAQALVLCGPGNNGADGFVAAADLARHGWSVRVACLVSLESLKDDAARAAQMWDAEVESFEGLTPRPGEVVVDAVFGAGFSGPLPPSVSAVFEAVEEADLPVVAVDIASGVDGDTGATDPAAMIADRTVTFFRKKPGHLLAPGLAYNPQVTVCDIGIPEKVLEHTGIAGQENDPALWRYAMPAPTIFDNKYTRGHAIVFGGRRMTGAAIMAAHGAYRVGAGVCTIVGPPAAADVYRSLLPNALFEAREWAVPFDEHLRDPRRGAVLIGPGAGMDDPENLRQAVRSACSHRDRVCVIDADAMSVFESAPQTLFKSLHGGCILTPHEGEFARIFPDLKGDKRTRTLAAAARAGAVVLLKGADTVVAAPDGRCVINSLFCPGLATAGSGDVLAGLILGLAVQKIPPFESACAAAWIHGRAASLFGPGLMATDIPGLVPQVLRDLG